MKVLIYYEKADLKPVGGPAGYLYNLYNEILKQNITEIEFLNSKKSKIDNCFRFLFNKMPVRIRELYYNKKKKQYGMSLYNRIFDSRKRIAKINLNEYDIVHFHSTEMMYMVKDSLLDYRGKVILTSHSPKVLFKEKIDGIPHTEYIKNKEMFENLEVMDEYAFNRADYIIFPCKDAEEPYYNSWEKYKDIHFKNKDKYIYLPTGINKVNIYNDKDSIRKRYNIPQDAFVISYVGRHNEVKGYFKLKELGEKILARNNDVYFLIAGKQGDTKPLNNERWIEVGWTKHPHDYIAASDLFILPNKETYFDLVLLEVLSIRSKSINNKYRRK